MEHSGAKAAPFFAMDNVDYRPRGAPFPSYNHLDFGRCRLPPIFALEYLDRIRVRPEPAQDVENPSRMTDFSIERILSAEIGSKTSIGAPGSSAIPYLQCIFYPLYPVMPRVMETQVDPNDATPGVGQGSQEERQEEQQQWRPRVRTVFTSTQLQRLEELFERTRYPNPETRAEVARSIGLSEETVRIWFKNHRARRKRKTSARPST